MSEVEEDPCKICIVQTHCREFCPEGVVYYKKQMISVFSKKEFLLFKLDTLLLHSDETLQEFLRGHPGILSRVDKIRNVEELYNIVREIRLRKE